MKNIFKIVRYVVLAVIATFILNGCMNDLNVIPQDKSIITDQVFKDNPGAYAQNLGKLYAGLAVSGPTDAGSSDIQGLDNGYGQYMRAYWLMQEGTTDEAVIHWGDAGVPEMGTGTWVVSNQFIRAMYLRITYQARVVSEYLNMTTDAKLNDRGQSALIPEIKTYRAEARWLRAWSYFNAIDLFGKMGFVDENVPLGVLPKEKSRSELFDYVESELLAIIPDLKDPHTNDYGRVDKAAAWFLLAKLYLNSQVWTGKDRSTDCITMCNNIINAGYSLGYNYNELFLADNDKNNSSKEYIFTIPQDGLHLQSYGGMTFIIQSATLSDMGGAAVMGVGGWNGTTTRQELYNKFTAEDMRGMFFTDGHSLDITQLSSDTKLGYGVMKFRNVTSTGAQGSDGTFVDTDYPLLRLADVYLMYAEAVVRKGAGGDINKAVTYINELRDRAEGYSGFNDLAITASQLTLPFIIDERARELYWEGWRRQDLVRFGLFTSGYNWQWKGNAHNGADIPAYRNVFPIPSDQISMNPDLTQNTGY